MELVGNDVSKLANGCAAIAAGGELQDFTSVGDISCIAQKGLA